MNLAKLAATTLAPRSLFPEARHSENPRRGGPERHRLSWAKPSHGAGWQGRVRPVGAALARISTSAPGPLWPIGGIAAADERNHSKECSREKQKAGGLRNCPQKAAYFAAR